MQKTNTIQRGSRDQNLNWVWSPISMSEVALTAYRLWGDTSVTNLTVNDVEQLANSLQAQPNIADDDADVVDSLSAFETSLNEALAILGKALYEMDK